MSDNNMRWGSLTAVYTSASGYPVQIGAKWVDESTGKEYRFVYNSGATSWTINVPVGVFLTGTTRGLCSFTAATQLLHVEGGTDVTVVAGVALGTIATTEAGWIQCGGLGSVVTDGNADASDGLYVADNGVVALPTTEPTHSGRFGICATPDSAGAGGIICGVWLDRCFWN